MYLLTGSAHGQKPTKKTTGGGGYFPGPWAISLHMRKARASEGPTDLRFPMFQRRRPPNTGKRKLKSLMASRDPPEVPRWLPEPPRGPPGAVPEPPQSSPGALPRLSRGSLAASCLPCTNNMHGEISQQSPANSPSPAVLWPLPRALSGSSLSHPKPVCQPPVCPAPATSKHQPTNQHQQAITSQQPPACDHHPLVFRDPRKGAGGRRPKAHKYPPDP